MSSYPGGPTPTMHSPLVYNAHAPADNQWRNSLCGCFSDMGTCCLTATFPTAQYGLNRAKLQDDQPGECCKHGMIYMLLGAVGIPCIAGMQGRAAVRAKYGLVGGGSSTCEDCLIHTFCSPCAICQEGREINEREREILVALKSNAPGVQNMHFAQPQQIVAHSGYFTMDHQAPMYTAPQQPQQQHVYQQAPYAQSVQYHGSAPSAPIESPQAMHYRQ